MIHMSSTHYQSLRDDYSGLCRSCWTVNEGCEPDAENYTCASCEKPRVQGIENLLIMGLINIDEDCQRPFVKLVNRETKQVYSKEIQW